MKKLIAALTIATMIGTAHAASVPTYNHAYHSGYHHGQSDAYNNVARTAVIVGFAVIAGVVIYKLGQNSRWTTNQNGVAYRF